MREQQESDAIIAIVDDDPSVRKGLERLIRSVGWKTESFGSAQEFWLELVASGLSRAMAPKRESHVFQSNFGMPTKPGK
jgi:hypothetical protein